MKSLFLAREDLYKLKLTHRSTFVFFYYFEGKGISWDDMIAFAPPSIWMRMSFSLIKNQYYFSLWGRGVYGHDIWDPPPPSLSIRQGKEITIAIFINEFFKRWKWRIFEIFTKTLQSSLFSISKNIKDLPQHTHCTNHAGTFFSNFGRRTIRNSKNLQIRFTA